MSKENEKWKHQVVSMQAISRRYRIHTDRLRDWKRMYDAKVALPFESMSCSNDELLLDTIGIRRILMWQRSADCDPAMLKEIVARELAATKKRRCDKNLY